MLFHPSRRRFVLCHCEHFEAICKLALWKRDYQAAVLHVMTITKEVINNFIKIT
ncbi:MAG: hypothetical protein ACWA42_01735 [Lutibacter sp.]